jgi:transcriptional regulator with XRE-family HTH domain
MATVAHLPAVDEAHQVLGLTYKQVASALKADESTLQRWRTGISEPSPVFLTRLESLGELVTEIRKTFRKGDGARRWLATEAPAFGGQRPLELLLAGRIERVTSALQALNAGMTT